MNPPQRLASNETLQGLVSKSKLAKREIAFAPKAAFTQPDKIFRCIVFGAVNDAEVFLPAHLQRGLNETFLAPGNEVTWLDHHPFAAAAGQCLPPGDCVTDCCFILKRDHAPVRSGYDAIGSSGKAIGQSHMPNVIPLKPDLPFAREKMEGGDLQITDTRDRPYIGCPGCAVARGTLRTIGDVIAYGPDLQSAPSSPCQGVS